MHGLETDERDHVFELLRNAKLLALVQANAQEYLEKLGQLEDDLRRVA